VRVRIPPRARRHPNEGAVRIHALQMRPGSGGWKRPATRRSEVLGGAPTMARDEAITMPLVLAHRAPLYGDHAEFDPP
jgi:hypothetical protein